MNDTLLGVKKKVNRLSLPCATTLFYTPLPKQNAYHAMYIHTYIHTKKILKNRCAGLDLINKTTKRRLVKQTKNHLVMDT